MDVLVWLLVIAVVIAVLVVTFFVLRKRGRRGGVLVSPPRGSRGSDGSA